MLISCIGFDGSGKTTLTKIIVNELNQKEGIKFRYMYGALRTQLIDPILAVGRFLFARNIKQKENYSAFSKKKRENLKKHKYLFKQYEYLVMLNYLPQLLVKIALPAALGINLVTDRYVFDTVINISLNFGYSKEKVAEMARHYFRFVPEPDLVFLIDLPAEMAFQRKDDIFSIEYLHERRKQYRQLVDMFGMFVLDGTKPIAELKNDAMEIISKKWLR